MGVGCSTCSKDDEWDDDDNNKKQRSKTPAGHGTPIRKYRPPASRLNDATTAAARAGGGAATACRQSSVSTGDAANVGVGILSDSNNSKDSTSTFDSEQIGRTISSSSGEEEEERRRSQQGSQQGNQQDSQQGSQLGSQPLS